MDRARIDSEGLGHRTDLIGCDPAERVEARSEGLDAGSARVPDGTDECRSPIDPKGSERGDELADNRRWPARGDASKL